MFQMKIPSFGLAIAYYCIEDINWSKHASHEWKKSKIYHVLYKILETSFERK